MKIAKLIKFRYKLYIRNSKYKLNNNIDIAAARVYLSVKTILNEYIEEVKYTKFQNRCAQSTQNNKS